MVFWKINYCVKILCFLFWTNVWKISAEMPLSKASRYKRFNVGLYMKELRLARDDVESKTNLLRAKRRRLNRLEEKVSSVGEELEGAQKRLKHVNSGGKGRGRNSRTVVTGSGRCSERTRRRRNAETFQAAEEIHGSLANNTSSSTSAATVGLLEAVNSRCKETDILKAMSQTDSCKRIKNTFPKLYRQELELYEASLENMLRSVALYYSKGLIGKLKYRSVYRSLAYKHSSQKKKAVRVTVADCPIPRLVPYDRLISYIKSIDIGTLYSIRDVLCAGLEEEEKVDGCFRSLEDLLIRLLQFYVDSGLYELDMFGTENTFYVALGGDGAPFGKDDSSCAWLVSILNIGQGVLSCNENFLLFGANCSESCLAVKLFVERLLGEIKKIEQTTYPIICKCKTIQAKFVISEIPNDMKMLAFLAGELTNSAKYFSTFANVSTDTSRNCKGTFGTASSDTWQPWKYSERLAVVEKVEKLKSSLKKTLSDSTKRSKVTTYISSLKSRQEFSPLIGQLVDKAHVEPLHLKNNCCALAHRYLLKMAISMSSLSNSASSFANVPPGCLFAKYVETLRSKCSLSRLAKKVIKWFNDTGGSGRDFDYRFTGKDSRLFLHNFMFLVDIIEAVAKGRNLVAIHVHAFVCLCLRDCVALFSRINITADEIAKLKELCTNYFRGNSLYFSVTPTVWTLGNVVPSHVQAMHSQYGLGLGLNSMEGREAKHIAIATYSKNTAYLHRWQQIFRHEYISLIWLREKGYNTNHSLPSSRPSYIPKRASNNPEFCNCGLHKAPSSLHCRICSHSLRAKVAQSIKLCKPLTAF